MVCSPAAPAGPVSIPDLNPVAALAQVRLKAAISTAQAKDDDDDDDDGGNMYAPLSYPAP